MSDEADSIIGGAVVNSDDRAAVVFQKRIDEVVGTIAVVAAQMGDERFRSNEEKTSAGVVLWNQSIPKMLGIEAVEDIEDVQAYEGSADDLVKVRMVYHFRQMDRGDYAAVLPEVADLWAKAGIARKVSNEEFARVSAIIEANAKVPVHA